jgi:hypothetical protein
MENILKKIIYLESILENSRPFRNFEQIFNLIADLKNSLNNSSPVEEEPIIDTEQVVLMKNEEGIFEELTVNEEPTVEEKPVAKKPAAKKTTKK